MSDDALAPTTAEAPFHVMTKPNGPSCNLDCSYCFYLEKADLYPERSDFAMSEETLETFVRQYIEAQPGPQVTFAWQGGEPTLLGVDFFRKAVEFQERYAPDGVRVQNTLQTNGTLLDEEWGEFLAAEDFLVGISIDGPRDLHDRYRSTRAGDATFDEVLSGLSVLQEHGVEHNVLCVLNAYNSQRPLDVYEFFKDLGVDWIQFIPLVEPVDGSGPAPDDGDDPPRGAPDHEAPAWVRERGGDPRAADPDGDEVLATARDAPVTDRSVDPEAYGAFMCAVFDEWVRDDVGEVSVRLFEQVLQVRRTGEASLCVFDETCGRQVALEHNGDLYACDHFVDPGFERGNVHETHIADLVDDPEQQQFGEYKREGLPPRCRDCPVRAYCNGGCPKNWLLETPAGEAGLNYLCPGYRRFFTYVQPYLDLFDETLDEGLPPEMVSDAVAVRDERGA